jgi:hypothetical protein
MTCPGVGGKARLAILDLRTLLFIMIHKYLRVYLSSHSVCVSTQQQPVIVPSNDHETSFIPSPPRHHPPTRVGPAWPHSRLGSSRRGILIVQGISIVVDENNDIDQLAWTVLWVVVDARVRPRRNPTTTTTTGVIPTHLSSHIIVIVILILIVVLVAIVRRRRQG